MTDREPPEILSYAAPPAPKGVKTLWPSFLLTTLNVAACPLHQFVSCEMSGRLAGASLALAGIAAVLAIIAQRRSGRLLAIVIAIVGPLTHSVFTH